MKIYISLPISGYNVELCKERAERLKTIIAKIGHVAISPFDVCPEPEKSYSYYIGRDIEALMECDAIIRCTGWSRSKGCALESECAHIYRKKIFDSINQIKQFKK